jgi:hypothetical protein
MPCIGFCEHACQEDPGPYWSNPRTSSRIGLHPSKFKLPQWKSPPSGVNAPNYREFETLTRSRTACINLSYFKIRGRSKRSIDLLILWPSSRALWTGEDLRQQLYSTAMPNEEAIARRCTDRFEGFNFREIYCHCMPNIVAL